VEFGLGNVLDWVSRDFFAKMPFSNSFAFQ
jgi:hypothetical protein